MKIFDLIEILESLDQEANIKILGKNELGVYLDGEFCGSICFKNKEYVKDDDCS
jgi:hypothetical protein